MHTAPQQRTRQNQHYHSKGAGYFPFSGTKPQNKRPQPTNPKAAIITTTISKASSSYHLSLTAKADIFTLHYITHMREAKRKLDAEIADELEKAEMVTNQAVGKMFRSRMKDDLPLKKYGEIIEFMFLHEDCAEFIAEATEKYRQEQEKAKSA